jgi:hypothetical protein
VSVRSVVCVHRKFERSWPYTADHWHARRRAFADDAIARFRPR